ncbi:MAG: PAS domain S-box protein [Thermodesulfobacteriota bacterium]
MWPEIRKNQGKFSKIFQASPAWVVISALEDGRYLEVNEAFLKSTGFSRDEIIGKTALDLKIWAEAKDRALLISELEEKGSVRNKEIKLLKKSGEVLEVLLSAEIIEIGGEKCLLSTSLDITDLKRTEAALREAMQIVNKSPAVVFLWKNEEGWPVEYVSENVIDLFGYAAEDFMNHKVLYSETIHPEDLPRVIQEVSKYSAEAGRMEFIHEPYRIVAKDGKVKWLDDRTTIRRDEKGKITHYQGIVLDITERKRAEEAIKESEEQYRLLVENAQELILIIQDGQIRFINQQPLKTLGYSPEEVLSKPFIEFIHPEDREMVFQNYLKRIRGEKSLPEVYSFRILDKEGNVRHLEVNAVLISYKGRLATLNFLRDISKRVQAEEELKKKEIEATILARENALLAEVAKIISSSLNIDEVYEKFVSEVKKFFPFDKISIGIVDFATNMVTLLYTAGKFIPGRNENDVFPLSGSFAAEVISQKKGIIYHPANEEEVAQKYPGFLPVYRAGMKSILTVPLISRDKVFGTLNFTAASRQAYTDDHLRLAEKVANQIAGAIANALLFAEHQRAAKEKAALQEQLLQAQKMEAIGRLAGGIAHDFNNSLTLMKVAAQLAQSEMPKGDPLQEKIDIIIGAADRSANLARQLLAFSRRQVLEMKIIDLNSLIRELDKMLQRVIGEDIELVYMLAEDLKKVKVDPGQMEQVILNLALNARDAMPKGGRLTIETANVGRETAYRQLPESVPLDSYVMLSISDTGTGMAPEVKPHIFEPFFTTKEKGKGTGLGLSTVYGIVKQIGGHIWFDSEVGKGTIFKIYLPPAEEPVEALHKKEVDFDIPTGKETILLVEDDENVRKLACQILERQGYKVLLSSHGEEALSICEDHGDPINLLLTDVVMPGLNGWDLANAVSIFHPQIKVLYMSGYPDEVITDYGILKPGINYIQKPFTVDSLAKKVRAILDNSSEY